MKKYFYSGIVALSIALIGSYVVAQADQSFWAGRINWMVSGALNFIERVNSSGQLVIYNNTTGDESLNIDDADGSALLRSRTSAQIGVLTPTRTGALIVNSSVNALCIATSTVQGGWVVVGSTAAANQMIAGDTGNYKRCW